MARRRLTPLDPAAAGIAVLDRPAALRLNPSAPIARVAAEAASAAALEDLAATVAQARAAGRMVLDLPLDAIAPDHLTRDRLPAEDEEMAVLRASIRLHGQRTPIEVTPLSGALPYGLISGWRRLEALKALVRRPETAADAYVTMVEENEIRVGLSHYERARVAARATERGVFASEKAALRALFATASRPKRSRIRAFLEIYHALDGTLRFPAHLPERQGLALVGLIRAGGAGRIAEAVARADPATPEAERAALERLLRKPAAARPAPEPLRPGLSLETRLAGRTLTLRLRGSAVTPALADEIRETLRRLGSA
jgi:hypothetical protein